ncbi:hypothetical protein [Aurantimonas marina]|uniref:hypothetical protein n=1 Tax=Aurantimonas marina TaxID=2780508 RepID=UPI0019D30ADD|nr:hypothetical protein [Aurantimonas marina]
MFKAFLLSTTTGLTFALLAAQASAQQNTLTIEQSGDGNSLFVDQSLASNSRVGGLKVDGSGELPNLDAGVPISLTDTAVQSGGNNRATITIRNDGGGVFLDQRNNGAGVNEANVTSSNGGVGVVAQNGTGNFAELQVDGNQPSPLSLPFTRPLLGGTTETGAINGAVIQNGDDNSASLATGLQTSGAIVQNGSGSNASLDLTLSNPGSSVIYSQNGSNLQSLTDLQVITNALGPVTVTQTNSAGVTTRGAVTINQTTPGPP